MEAATQTPPNHDRAEIGRRLKAARALRGWSLRDLERAVRDDGQVGRGLAYTTLRQIEAGSIRKLPDGRDLQYLAELCGRPATWFHVDSIDEAVRVRLPAVARLPALTGELGRRAGDDTPDALDPRPGANRPEDDEETGTDG